MITEDTFNDLVDHYCNMEKAGLISGNENLLLIVYLEMTVKQYNPDLFEKITKSAVNEIAQVMRKKRIFTSKLPVLGKVTDERS